MLHWHLSRPITAPAGSPAARTSAPFISDEVAAWARPIRTFTVLPHLPARLQALHKLAYNMWWCWNHDAIALFRRIDADLFEAVEHSPVKLLGAIEQDRAGATAARRRLPGPHGPRRGGARRLPDGHDLVSGDLRRADEARPAAIASPTSRPSSAFTRACRSTPAAWASWPATTSRRPATWAAAVGVGLMYREGYFRQYLNVDGWQQERYPENDFFNLPLIPETQPDGTPLLVSVPFPGREVCVRDLAHPGRPGAALPARHQHPAEQRRRPQITARLYGGDHDMRIRQEMVLGIGGIRALQRPGQDADRLPHERGALGVLRPGAHPRADGGDQPRFRRGPRGRRGRHLSSPRTRRCRPATTSSRRS